MTPTVAHRLNVSRAFVAAAACYWTSVFPRVRRELQYWRRRAAEISNPELRRLALETHESKWCNVEGAAAFAIFAPAASRKAAITALVSFQAAYDYADTLSELPAANPIANGRRLHEPLHTAFGALEHPDYYAHCDLRGDSGYLNDLTDSCRKAFRAMPSFALVQNRVQRAAGKIITYQSLNHGGKDTSTLMRRWATRETPSGSGLRWWETSAACASSLTALALISAAANPELTTVHVRGIEDAYDPWVGALHTLLDSLIDWEEDNIAGQESLLDHYQSPLDLQTRMRVLARRSREALNQLPASTRHTLLLAAMTGTYITNRDARTATAWPVAKCVRNEIGDFVRPVLFVLRARQATRTRPK